MKLCKQSLVREGDLTPCLPWQTKEDAPFGTPFLFGGLFAKLILPRQCWALFVTPEKYPPHLSKKSSFTSVRMDIRRNSRLIWIFVRLQCHFRVQFDGC
jgi:hypothetical protein